MTKDKISRLVLVIFIIAASVFFFLIVKADADLWGHIKFGQDIYEAHAIPRYDTYSYSAYGSRWINHEWLSELIFYAILKHAKGAGLNLFKFFIGLLITCLLYKAVKAKTASVLLQLAFILAPLSLITYGFAIRPQIFTYLLFTVVVFLIDRVERGLGRKWLFLLPLIFLVWCNLHGGFVAGLGVLLVYALVKLFTQKLTAGAACAVVLSALATLVNPYGAQLWRFLAVATMMARPFITEWQTIQQYSFNLIGYIVVSLAAVIGIFFLKEKRYIYEIELLAIGLCISFRHSRHSVLFAILTSVYVPEYLGSIAGGRLERLENEFSRNFFNAVCICFSVFFMLGVLGSAKTNPFRIEIKEEEYPVEAVEFIRANGIKGNIFAWFNWGEMCIRELSRANKVFIDGRYETVYGDDLINGYFGVIYDKIDYNGFLSRFPQTDIMLLSRENPVLTRVACDRSWMLVYLSSTAAIFLKDNQNNKEIVKRARGNGLTRPKMTPPFYFE